MGQVLGRKFAPLGNLQGHFPILLCLERAKIITNTISHLKHLINMAVLLFEPCAIDSLSHFAQLDCNVLCNLGQEKRGRVPVVGKVI